MVRNSKIGIEFDSQMKSRALNFYSGKAVALGELQSSHYITTCNGNIEDFQLHLANCEEIIDKFGAGKKYTISEHQVISKRFSA